MPDIKQAIRIVGDNSSFKAVAKDTEAAAAQMASNVNAQGKKMADGFEEAAKSVQRLQQLVSRVLIPLAIFNQLKQIVSAFHEGQIAIEKWDQQLSAIAAKAAQENNLAAARLRMTKEQFESQQKINEYREKAKALEEKLNEQLEKRSNLYGQIKETLTTGTLDSTLVERYREELAKLQQEERNAQSILKAEQDRAQKEEAARKADERRKEQAERQKAADQLFWSEYDKLKDMEVAALEGVAREEAARDLALTRLQKRWEQTNDTRLQRVLEDEAELIVKTTDARIQAIREKEEKERQEQHKRRLAEIKKETEARLKAEEEVARKRKELAQGFTIGDIAVGQGSSALLHELRGLRADLRTRR
jgi:hypothetical protein